MDSETNRAGSPSLKKNVKRIETDYLREKSDQIDREKELIIQITRIFNQEERLGDCLNKVLTELALFTNRQVTEIWLSSIDHKELRLSGQHIAQGTAELQQEKLELNSARGLIGKSWTTKAPFYIEHLESSKEFTRAPFVLSNSLISGTAIPVMSRNEVIAVLGFYGTPESDNQFPVGLSQNVIVQLASDIKRKKVEEELYQFFSLSPDLLGMIGTDGFAKKINPGFNKVLGFHEQEFLSTPFTQFVLPLDRDFVATNLQLIAAGNAINSFEARFIARDSEAKWITWSGSFLAEEELLFLVGKDITEKKELELSIKESEERFRVIFEQAAVGVAMLDSNTGQLLRVNKKYSEIFGHSHEELDHMTFMEFTHPEDLETDLHNMSRLRNGEIREFAMEKRHFRKDKSVIWVNLSVSPMWKEGEAPTTHIAIVQDITARKTAEEKVRLSGLEK
jgi:PAS domain S-box-containing protein